MLDAVREIEGVTFHDLYEAYPDLMVDVPREQGLLAEHDPVVGQHPFYWYSAPVLVKEWIDLVLTHGWAYGEGGTALAGKTWLSAITSGGSEGSYGRRGGTASRSRGSCGRSRRRWSCATCAGSRRSRCTRVTW